MTISSAAGIAFARELGCQRVVLARECSLAEIEKIRKRTAAAAPCRPLLRQAILRMFPVDQRPPRPRCRWKFLFTARCVWPIPGNA
jgi:hypothetical protein